MKIENRVGNVVFRGFDELERFQGGLKELSKESYAKLKQSFLRHGNIAPLFVWNGNILDGHQRLFTLKELRKEGVDVPDKVPCVEIEAEDEKEAKRFLLQYVSQQGRVTEEGLYEFLWQADLVDDFEELKGELDIAMIDLEEFEEGWLKDVVGNVEINENEDGNDKEPKHECPECGHKW